MSSIYRRGRIYWARAQRNGREFRQSLETADRRVAERRLADWLERLGCLAWGERPRRTFAEAVEKFITEHCAALKPASARRYAVSLKALADSFDGLHLDQITRDKLSEFETTRRVTPIKHMGKAVRLPSPSTIRRDLACLSALMSACEEWNWTAEGSNPVPGFMRRRAKRGLKEAPPRTRYLTESEEAELIAAATPSVRRAIIVAIDTGLRLEEQFSLTWRQIDFKRGLIVTTKRTKSGRARYVPLPQRAADALGELVSQPHVGPLASIYVFRHDTGERLLNMKKGLAGARQARRHPRPPLARPPAHGGLPLAAARRAHAR